MDYTVKAGMHGPRIESGPEPRTVLAFAFPLGFYRLPQEGTTTIASSILKRNKKTGHSPLDLAEERACPVRDETGRESIEKAMVLEPSHYELQRPNNASKLFNDRPHRISGKIRYTTNLTWVGGRSL